MRYTVSCARPEAAAGGGREAPAQHGGGQGVGLLLPADGPRDYEWHDVARRLARRGWRGPRMVVGDVHSDGRHARAALAALGRPDRLAPVARQLRARGCCALIWACTSASFVNGLDWALWQARELQSLAGVPATSTSLAIRDALAHLGHRRVDLLSAYPDSVTSRLTGFLSDCGVTVGAAQVLDCGRAADSHALDIVAAAREFRRRREGSANPLLIPDTAINTLELTQRLQAAARAPVITANQATLWQALNMVDWPQRPDCLGVLADG